MCFLGRAHRESYWELPMSTCMRAACHRWGALRQAQAGFTLVEAAIVLVIAALLTTAILSSQNILRASRVNNLVGTVSEVRSAVAGFQDRYGYMPGDCPNTVSDCTLPLAGTIYSGSGNGDGVINCCAAGLGVAAAGNESFISVIHLFNTGFLAKIDAGNPNAFLGTPWGAIDITQSDSNSNVTQFLSEPGNTAVRHVMVFSNLPCEIVLELDIKIDDGNVFSGRALGDALAGVAGCPEGNRMPFYAVAL